MLPFSWFVVCFTLLITVYGHDRTVIHFPEAATNQANLSSAHLPSQSRHCIVTPYGWGRDDSSQILAATQKCARNSVITLPAPFVYTISRRMYMKLDNVRLEILGTLSFTPDLLYWIGNSFRVEFQNQSTAWIVEGHDVIVTGGGWRQGGIDGNGQAWMTRAAGHSNQFGRPIALSLYNSSNVLVEDFSIWQPQFWSFMVQDSSNIELRGIYINGTNTDPNGNSSNYETNIDGLDTLRVDNLTAADWLFHGGDDCLAPKGNSTNLTFRNLTCVGGGVAFGSLGQYPDSPDYIHSVWAENITVAQAVSPILGGANVSGGAYFKSWVGVSEGEPPQGGGGGTGSVANVTFTNLTVHNTTNAISINKCYFKVADQANYCDTSTLEFGDLHFEHVQGFVSGDVAIALNCSAAMPCRDIEIRDAFLTSAKNGSTKVTCDNVVNLEGLRCNTTLSR
ncbi:glycoside hydrolase family 28 protein [Zasmidium cellare ATCC 36951]|uniref:galacturonan 1,4-alpha-galacturonidase n=1 Tax=Zasmidium cellare ATCC 36951 TaxID=1080233 RepID=A0A6A6CB02_ZASCE|nr:glycoside hydrolase family 28 protein [Zasmidium cellare ATCC 36951]KAF2164205.1 glycoside hydrolase family 28 protein [Zasmidium cellare ATCC 36951]